jgi:hypothetical protein
LVDPFEQFFELVEPALPEAAHLACPVDQLRQGAISVATAQRMPMTNTPAATRRNSRPPA